MPRELDRVKPDATEEISSSGLNEFRRERVTKEVSGITPGWSSSRRPKTNDGDKPVRFTVPDDGEEVLIKFLDEMPFAPIYQHWLSVEGKRRAYTCIYEEDGDTGKIITNCPLCSRGDKAKSSDWFNLVVLGDTPELQVWYASGDPSAAIEDKSNTKRYSPINKAGLYFAVSKRKGSNGFNTYTVDAVREEELSADWGVSPLTEDQLNKFNKVKYDGSLIKVPTSAELSEVARKYLED